MLHGGLFRGNSESAIRHEIIRWGFIKGIIGLLAKLFYGTGIPAYIVVLDRSTPTPAREWNHSAFNSSALPQSLKVCGNSDRDHGSDATASLPPSPVTSKHCTAEI